MVIYLLVATVLDTLLQIPILHQMVSETHAICTKEYLLLIVDQKKLYPLHQDIKHQLYVWHIVTSYCT